MNIPSLRELMSLASDMLSLGSFAVVLWGVAASLLLWRSSLRRHKFARVYFPKNRTDFYSYYEQVVSGARAAVYLTSDGFNMCNPVSSDAARRMNSAQAKAIARGARVVRYQITRTMHINWLHEIVKMKEAYGDCYCTLINRHFEDVGSFAVIDPGSRRAVVEFMLPDVGGIAQATTARDFGFIHGHQAKADETKALFDRIADHPESIEVTAANFVDIARSLFAERCARHRSDPHYHVFDEEILYAMKRSKRRSIAFEDVRFFGWPDEVSAFAPAAGSGGAAVVSERVRTHPGRV